MAHRIRLMEPRDVPAIEALHAAQNKRQGTNYPLSQVFDESYRRNPRVPLALTTLKGDEVVQGTIFEATGVEMMLAGCSDPRATAQLHKEIHAAFWLLRSLGFEVVNCLVPKDVIIPVEKPLKDVGFVRLDGRMALFQKDLTTIVEEEAELEPRSTEPSL